MKILSFDYNKIKRDSSQGRLFNLFEKNIVLNRNIRLFPYIVPREYEMRLDKISKHIYGSENYVEELMVINDLISPYSVKQDQILFYCSMDNLQSLYTTDQILKDDAGIKIIKSSSSSSKLQQITITKDNKVQILNSFE